MEYGLGLEIGVILVIECKGGAHTETRDTEEKDRIGQLWAARSKGQCRFVMVKNKHWGWIKKESVR